MWSTLLFAQANSELQDVSMVPFIIVLGIMLVVVGFTIAAIWKMFVKAGNPGWASLVPIYNILLMLKMIGRPAWYIILLFIPGVNVVFGVIMAFGMARSFGKGIPFALGMLLLSPIFVMILGFGDAQYVGPMGPSYRRGPKIP